MLCSFATGFGKSVDMWMWMGYPPLSTFRGFWVVGVVARCLFFFILVRIGVCRAFLWRREP